MSYSTRYAAITLCLAFLYGLPARADEEALDAYYTGDYQTAIDIWTPEAEAGDAEAQFYLGAMLSAGQGAKKDPAAAAKWFEKAARQGNVEAQYNLGVAYKDGLGVPQDNVKAVEWWRKAAEAGYARAQYNLASMYYYGQGVNKDADTARSWYSKAAEQGDEAAARILAKLSPARTSDSPKSSGDAAARQKAVIPLNGKPADLSKPAEASAVADDNSGDIQSVDWVLAQDANNYTVQLYASASKAAILDFISSHPVPDTVAYYKYQTADKTLYRVVTGSYISYLDAGEAVRRLSPQVKEWSPWIRKLAGIQKEIKASENSQPASTVAKGGNETKAPQAAAPAPVAKASQASAPQTAAKPDAVKQPPASAVSASLASVDPSHFAVQVFSAQTEDAVRSFIADAGLSEDTTVYRISRNGAPWYRAIYGDFSSLREAKQAVAQLPPPVRATKPWIRKYSSIKKEQATVVENSSAPAARKSAKPDSPSKPESRANIPPSPAQKPVTPPAGKATTPTRQAKTGKAAPAQVNPRHTPKRAARRASPAQVKKILRAGQTSFMVGDYVSAYRMWRPLAEDGVKEAQYDLGFMYESGWGVTQDFAEALSWYRSAAEQGEFRAQFNLGLLYLAGHGVDKNAEQGIYWIERAASKGHLRAQEFLANAYESGEYGLTIDRKKSRFWAAKAGLE